MNYTFQTIYHANGKAVYDKKTGRLTPEKDEPVHTEVGVINLYPEITFQEIEGFGGAMTESSACLLSGLEPAVRREILDRIFGADGLRYRYIRTSIDSCDFGLGQYQAVEDPLADPDFHTFTIDRDRKYIIPMIKEAMEAAAEPISVLLSPWSPPKQWKEPQKQVKNDAAAYGGLSADISAEPSRITGTLKKEYYRPWAVYIAKYVQAYLDEGIPVTMITMQNESIAATAWDSCVWEAEDQKIFLRDHLWPVFEEAGLTGKVGIFIWDHNKERVYEWAKAMLDEDTRKMAAGIAFHWYSGDHFEAVGLTRDAFPEMTLMLSECCCGMEPPAVDPWFIKAHGMKTQAHADYLSAALYAHDMIGNLNNGMNRWIEWNLCLDPRGLPRTIDRGCNAGIIIDGDSWHETLIYHYVKAFSGSILPGARRIALSRCSDSVEAAAAVNPDGTVTLILLNQKNEDQRFSIRMNGLITVVVAPAETISVMRMR